MKWYCITKVMVIQPQASQNYINGQMAKGQTTHHPTQRTKMHSLVRVIKMPLFLSRILELSHCSPRM